MDEYAGKSCYPCAGISLSLQKQKSTGVDFYSGTMLENNPALIERDQHEVWAAENIAANRTSTIAEMDNAFFFKLGSDFHIGSRGLSPIVLLSFLFVLLFRDLRYDLLHGKGYLNYVPHVVYPNYHEQSFPTLCCITGQLINSNLQLVQVPQSNDVFYIYAPN